MNITTYFRALYSTASLAIMSFCVVFPTHANAIVMFQQGVNSYTGTHDVELREDAPNSNFDGATAMTIDEDDGGVSLNDTNALLRFDGIVGGGVGQIPIGATIISASLQLFVASGGNNINMHQMLTGWSQGTATWNNLGANNDGITVPGDAAFLRMLIGRPTMGSPLDVSGVSQVFDVTTELQNWANGASNFGWGFTPILDDGVDFSTSENGTIAERPKLTVDFRVPGANVPEPGILALFGFGLAGLGFARFKRRTMSH